QMPISHGFTYMGDPTCCAAALANIAIIERERLPENSADVGAYLLAHLREVLGGFDSVGEIRGVGLMIGIELVADKATKPGFSRSAAGRSPWTARTRSAQTLGPRCGPTPRPISASPTASCRAPRRSARSASR